MRFLLLKLTQTQSHTHMDKHLFITRAILNAAGTRSPKPSLYPPRLVCPSRTHTHTHVCFALVFFCLCACIYCRSLFSATFFSVCYVRFVAFFSFCSPFGVPARICVCVCFLTFRPFSYCLLLIRSEKRCCIAAAKKEREKKTAAAGKKTRPLSI